MQAAVLHMINANDWVIMVKVSVEFLLHLFLSLLFGGEFLQLGADWVYLLSRLLLHDSALLHVKQRRLTA